MQRVRSACILPFDWRPSIAENPVETLSSSVNERKHAGMIARVQPARRVLPSPWHFAEHG